MLQNIKTYMYLAHLRVLSAMKDVYCKICSPNCTAKLHLYSFLAFLSAAG